MAASPSAPQRLGNTVDEKHVSSARRREINAALDRLAELLAQPEHPQQVNVPVPNPKTAAAAPLQAPVPAPLTPPSSPVKPPGSQTARATLMTPEPASSSAASSSAASSSAASSRVKRPSPSRALFPDTDNHQSVFLSSKLSLKELRGIVDKYDLSDQVKTYVGGKQRRRKKVDIVKDLVAALTDRKIAFTTDGTSIPSAPLIDPSTGLVIDQVDFEHNNVEANIAVFYRTNEAGTYEEVWFATSTMWKVLGYSKNPFPDHIKKNPSSIESKTIAGFSWCVDRRGLLRCTQTMKKANAIGNMLELLELFFEGLTLRHVLNTNEEDKWISNIQEAAHHFESKPQCVVKTPAGSFTIDLYFPNELLAIECDEHGHKSYKNDRRREDAIRDYLKCRFYRFDPHCDDPNHTMSFHVGEIIHLLYNKTEVQSSPCY
jgi:hypothetical protein